MSKYKPLASFLRQRPVNELRCSFAEIEQALGFALPPAARTHRAWWSNNDSNNVMTRVWLKAGYRAEQVDMAGETVVFRRISSAPSGPALAQENGSLKIHDAEMIARILDVLRGEPAEAQELRRTILAALKKKRARNAIDLFASELPDEAFEGVFDRARQTGWREVEL